MSRRRRRAPPALAGLGIALLLSGCGTGTPAGRYTESRPVAGHPRYTIAPYQVGGIWYYPKVDYGYDETGTASWYGPQFDRRPTADGETFDMNRLSAAHKTLPLPSVVEVTNLDNGRSLELRVNDRGPFVGDRLIDVSRRAAQLLGFETAGTAQVRVKILKDESIAVAEAAIQGEPAPLLAEAAAPVVAAPRRPPPAPAPAPMRVAAAPLPPPPVVAEPRPVLAERPPVLAEPPAPRPIARPAPAPAPIRLAENPTAEPTPTLLPPARPAPSPRFFADRIERALFPPAAAATFEPLRAPAQRPKAASPQSRIFVQAGAFAQRDNAERAQASIARLGAVQITAARVNGAELYRVRLGPVPSLQAANALLARVVGSGYAGARIVAD